MKDMIKWDEINMGLAEATEEDKEMFDLQEEEGERWERML